MRLTTASIGFNFRGQYVYCILYTVYIVLSIAINRLASALYIESEPVNRFEKFLQCLQVPDEHTTYVRVL